MTEHEQIVGGAIGDSIAEANQNVGHADFVAGVQNGTLGFTCIGGEPYQLIRGTRRRIFSIFVFLYAIVPFAAVPLWAWHEGNWWLLLGTVASAIGSVAASGLIRSEKNQNSVGGTLLMGVVASWFWEGFRSYPTFFGFCALWGFMLFMIADNVERQYALDSLLESPELFDHAIADSRIMIVSKEGG